MVQGSLSLTNTPVSDNQTGGTAYIDVYAGGSLTVSNSTLMLDRITTSGTGSVNFGNSTLTLSTLTVNSGGGSFTVSNSTLTVSSLSEGNSSSLTVTGSSVQTTTTDLAGAFSFPSTELRGSQLYFRNTSSGTFVYDGKDLGSMFVTIQGADVTIRNSTLGGVAVASGLNPVIDGNTFKAADVVYCTADYWPELLDNTFASTSAATVNLQGGTVGQDQNWGVLGSVNYYRIGGNTTVALGKTLTVGSGVRVTQAGNCDLTVNGALVLASNSQLDQENPSADITVNGSLTMQAGSRMQVGQNASLTINAGGTMTATDAQWLKLNDGWFSVCFRQA